MLRPTTHCASILLPRTLVGLSVFAFLAMQHLSIGEAQESSIVFPSKLDLRIQTNSDQVTLDANDESLDVDVKPGSNQYPGLSIAPPGEPWDLSKFGYVEARVENTGDEDLQISLRIDDDADWKSNPYNTESTLVPAGQTETLRVIFGYQYGYQPGHALKSDHVIQMLLFATNLKAPATFRLHRISAGGEPGMLPPGKRQETHSEPKNGDLLAHLNDSNLATTFKFDGGVQLSRHRNSLRLKFDADQELHKLSLLPPTDFWNLRASTAVKVAVTNQGDKQVAISAQVTSDRRNSTAEETIEIEPGKSIDLIVLFEAKQPWVGKTPQGNNGASQYPDTGTAFRGDRATSVDLAIAHKGVASLEVKQMSAFVQPAEIPDWLGHRPPTTGDWKLTFEDNFNGTQIDESKWNVYGPNWWGEHELTHWSKENVIVADGTATLRMEKKHGWHLDDEKSGHQTDYAGGYLDTVGKWRQKYGYFEARMKLPTTEGVWPAFWTMPDRGPDAQQWTRHSTESGGMEFDIMEHLTRWGPYRYNIAAHWDGYKEDHQHLGTSNIYVQPDEDGYITPGFLWEPGRLTFYCNGKVVGRWEDERVGDIPSYFIIYQVIGGWDNDRFNPKQLPADYIIDYVRAWQRADLAEKEGQ